MYWINDFCFCMHREKTSTPNMKMDALSFLNILFTHHSRTVFYPHVSVILPAVITCVNDSFYKIISEALSVLKKIVEIIKPLGQYIIQ